MQEAVAKPPYVTFETRAVEDRTAAIENGHYTTRDEVYAIVTPQGSKDKIEKVAETWLNDIETASREERFPAEWVRAYRGAFQDYLAGRETPLEGTPVLGWQLASPSQQNNVIAANIRTVEDLAVANESSLNAIGMGARALKEKAISWLASAGDTGKVAAQNEALRKAQEDLTEQVTGLTAQLKAANAKIEKLEKETA